MDPARAYSLFRLPITRKCTSLIDQSYKIFKNIAVTLACFWVALCNAPLAHAQALPASVAAALNTAGIPQSAVAVVVQDAEAGKPLLVAHNARAAMNPASTIKLVTTYSALELLGPQYTWKTSAWSAAAQNDEVLEGDLILRGGGDPKFTFEHFGTLLRGLRARGIREIRGDLLLDRSWMDASSHDPGKFDGEPTRAYNVGPDALLLNFKAFRFLFQPDQARRVVALVTEPPSAALEATNNLRLVDGPCGDWLARVKIDLRTETQKTGRQVRAGFSGSYPATCGEREWNVALLTHNDYFAGVFRKLWEELGGTFKGNVREGTNPPGARLLAAQESLPLAEIVRDINKFSNNVMARQLYLTLSAELLGMPGRTDRSQGVVRGWLDQKSISMPELVLENGSGLSREERISAGNLARLLEAAFRSQVMPELLASLPLVAHDGTMRRRMKFEPIAGQAHIKTGSLTGVNTIAGYVLDRQGRRKIVVFFINHANAGAGRAAQDALIRWAYEAR